MAFLIWRLTWPIIFPDSPNLIYTLFALLPASDCFLKAQKDLLMEEIRHFLFFFPSRKRKWKFLEDERFLIYPLTSGKKRINCLLCNPQKVWWLTTGSSFISFEEEVLDWFYWILTDWEFFCLFFQLINDHK